MQRRRESLGPRIFEPPIVTAEGAPGAGEVPLPDEEALAVARAVEKRRREFVAGRQLAREALGALSVRDVVIPMGPDRAPQWPAGIVGSISHTSDWCVVAVSNDPGVVSVGVDVEQSDALADKLVPSICTEEEIRWLEAQPLARRGLLAKLVFSAKEAVYKCQYPLTRRFLEFADVIVELDEDAGTFAARRATNAAELWPHDAIVRARFVVSDGHVACGVALLRR